MFQSWYLPCDLHMFFIGTVLTLLLSRHRRTGLAFIVVFLAASMIIPFFVTLLGKKPALLEMLPRYVIRCLIERHKFPRCLSRVAYLHSLLYLLCLATPRLGLGRKTVLVVLVYGCDGGVVFETIPIESLLSP